MNIDLTHLLGDGATNINHCCQTMVSKEEVFS